MKDFLPTYLVEYVILNNGVDNFTQTSTSFIPKFELRQRSRNFNDSIKIALASSCVVANISSEQARKSFQTISEIFYGMKYYLSSNEAPLENNGEPVNKKPQTEYEYRMLYVDVLPSSKTISRMKHHMALQEERNAALAMLDAMLDEINCFIYHHSIYCNIT